MQRNRGFTGDIATQYDVWLRRPLFAPNAVEIEKRVPRGQCILDLACGPCVVAERLAMRRTLLVETDPPKIIGCDRNFDMMRPALQRAEFFGIPLTTADACALPYRADSFDAVVCQFGWMFFDDRLLAMREILRVLKCGGQVAISTWAPMTSNPWIEVAREAVSKLFPQELAEFYNAPFVMADDSQCRDLLITAGFEDIHHSLVELDLNFSSAFAFATGFTRSNAAVMNLSDQYHVEAETIVEAIQAAAAAVFGDQPMVAKMRSNLFTGRKSSQ